MAMTMCDSDYRFSFVQRMNTFDFVLPASSFAAACTSKEAEFLCVDLLPSFFLTYY